MATATLPNASTPSPQLHIEISAKSCIENDNLEPKIHGIDENINQSFLSDSKNEEGHANFKLGVEDSPELINELRFSIAHSRHASGKNSSRRQSSSKSRSSTNPKMQLTDEEDELGKVQYKTTSVVSVIDIVNTLSMLIFIPNFSTF